MKKSNDLAKILLIHPWIYLIYLTVNKDLFFSFPSYLFKKKIKKKNMSINYYHLKKSTSKCQGTFLTLNNILNYSYS